MKSYTNYYFFIVLSFFLGCSSVPKSSKHQLLRRVASTNNTPKNCNALLMSIIQNGRWKTIPATDLPDKVLKFNTKRLKGHGLVDGIKNAQFNKIISEPQVHFSDANFAFQNGGDLTRLALGRLQEVLTPEEFARLRVDTKVHVLRKGEVPSIPGWHGDYVVRDSNGKLAIDLERDENTRHFLILSGPPGTQWLKQGKARVFEGDEINWGKLSEGINNSITNDDIFSTPPGRMMEFYSNSLHRGVPYEVSDGEVHARFFFRATLFPEGHPSLSKPFSNKVRTQQQVYVPFDPKSVNNLAPPIKETKYSRLREAKITSHKKMKKYADDLIEKEPRLKLVTVDYAEENGGEVTKSALKKLREEVPYEVYKRLRIQVDVHMMNKDWLARKPGWSEEDFFVEGLSSSDKKKVRQFILYQNPPSTEFIQANGNKSFIKERVFHEFEGNQLFSYKPFDPDTKQFSWRYQIRAVYIPDELGHKFDDLVDESSIQHEIHVPRGTWW